MHKSLSFWLIIGMDCGKFFASTINDGNIVIGRYIDVQFWWRCILCLNPVQPKK